MSPLEQRVHDLRLQDKGIKEISIAIGKTYSQTNSVIQRLRILGILHHQVSKRNMDRVPENDIDGDIEKGLRCPKCWILFPADCTPDQCMARHDVFNSQLPAIARMMTATAHYADMYKWE